MNFKGDIEIKPKQKYLIEILISYIIYVKLYYKPAILPFKLISQEQSSKIVTIQNDI